MTARHDSRTARRVGGVVAAAVALALLGGACAPSRDVTAAEASGLPGTLPSPVTLPEPVTTPPPSTIPITTAAPEATTTTVPPTTTTLGCAADQIQAADGSCVTTTVPLEPTTVAMPQPAAPDPAPPLAAPVTPIGKGSSRDQIRAAQQRLLDLGFWLQAVNGQYDWTTSQAVMAFQKHSGFRPASGRIDQRTADALNGAATRVTATANLGTLIEVDKAKQVLYIVRDGKTLMALNTSTGSGRPYVEQNQKDPTKTERGDSQTPAGWFKVFRENAKGWVEGDLGKIYRPKTFNGGIAVHGMTNVPNYPASHGCVRVSLPAMDMIWADNLMPLGMRVWVHGPSPTA